MNNEQTSDDSNGNPQVRNLASRHLICYSELPIELHYPMAICLDIVQLFTASFFFVSWLFLKPTSRLTPKHMSGILL